MQFSLTQILTISDTFRTFLSVHLWKVDETKIWIYFIKIKILTSARKVLTEFQFYIRIIGVINSEARRNGLIKKSAKNGHDSKNLWHQSSKFWLRYGQVKLGRPIFAANRHRASKFSLLRTAVVNFLCTFFWKSAQFIFEQREWWSWKSAEQFKIKISSNIKSASFLEGAELFSEKVQNWKRSQNLFICGKYFFLNNLYFVNLICPLSGAENLNLSSQKKH